MFQAEKGANAIPGYTGFMPTQDQDSDLLQIQENRNHIPNYAGFVPGIKSENLFGKTFGKITLLSSTRSHNKESDLPSDLRYISEVKEAFSDVNLSKTKDIYLYSKLDPKTQKSLTYTLTNLTNNDLTKTTKVKDTKERESNLTYKEAIKLAGK